MIRVVVSQQDPLKLIPFINSIIQIVPEPVLLSGIGGRWVDDVKLRLANQVSVGIAGGGDGSGLQRDELDTGCKINLVDFSSSLGCGRFGDKGNCFFD